MESVLERLVIFIARIHNHILTLNDAYEKNFTDKELHFIVVGVFGIALLMVIYPLFKLLSKNHVLTIAFIYVFTLVIVVTFAIEIGQRLTGTGTMEFADIVFGVVGFLLMYVIFAIIVEVLSVIIKGIKNVIDH